MHFLWRCQPFCRERFKKDHKKETSRTAGDVDNRRKERLPWKYFRCGSEDNLISTFPKPPKENEKRQNQVHFNEKGNRASYNSKNNNEHKICESLACMSDNDNCLSRNFGDSSQLTNWILDSGATCHMKPWVSDFIPC